MQLAFSQHFGHFPPHATHASHTMQLEPVTTIPLVTAQAFPITTKPLVNDTSHPFIGEDLLQPNALDQNTQCLPTTINITSLFLNSMNKIDYVCWFSYFRGVLRLHDLGHVLDEPDQPVLLESNKVNLEYSHWPNYSLGYGPQFLHRSNR